jgi:hypothetical protein
MKILGSFSIATVSLLSLFSTVRAGDDKSVAITVPDPDPPRWSVSAGVTASTIRTNFRANPNLRPAFLDPSSNGSGNLYTGGPNAEVYGDGAVGIPGTTDAPDGTTGFTGGTVTLVTQGQFGYSLSQASFHSTSTTSGPFLPDSDTSAAVGPYIKFEYLIKQYEALSFSAFAQYTFTTAFNSGVPSSSSVVTNQTFGYDVYNGDLSNTVAGAAVYNAAAFPNNQVTGAGVRAAQPPTVQTTQTFFSILAPESINIDLHTFTLGLNITRDLGSRVHLVAATGPTLNLFDYNFSTPGILVVNGIPYSAGAPQNNNGQAFRFGWIGQIGITIDLDSQKLYFVELDADYHWIQKFEAATSFGSASVNASAWGASLGLGRRF